MAEKIQIKVPLTKTYFNTFILSYSSIYFYNDKTHTLETLKNLLFPADHPDKEFNELIDYVNYIFEGTIKKNKTLERLQNELDQSYIFEEEQLNTIYNILSSKRNEILNRLNSKFNSDSYTYSNLDWKIKSILSASKEDYFQERYSDLEFIYQENNEINNKTISFTRTDIDKMLQEMKKIRENLIKINKLNN